MTSIKKLALAALVAAVSLVVAPSGVQTAEAKCDRKCESAKNEAAARAHCDKAKAEGKECKVVPGSIKGCGNGWSKAAKFAGKGKNYLACERSKRHIASESNKAEAEAYCAEKKRDGTNCKVIKSRIQGCGKGWIRGEKFKGKGKDYVACVQGAGRKLLSDVQPMQQDRLGDDCDSRKACLKECKSKSCRQDCRHSCRLEGCAPVAAAMLFSYWQGKGYDKLIVDKGYDGTLKPTATIRELMKKLKAMGFGDMGTATVAKFAKQGVHKWVKDQGYDKKLKVERMQALRGHEKITQQVMKNIDEGRPTMLLFNKREANIGGKCQNWHYVVAVGYDVTDPKDEKLLVLTGWEDGLRTQTSDMIKEVPFHGCGKKLNAGLIWLEESK